MSRDQKPGRMRVVGGAEAAPSPVVPARDPVPAAETSADALPAPASPIGPMLWPILVFLIGCAIGGVIFALIGRA